MSVCLEVAGRGARFIPYMIRNNNNNNNNNNINWPHIKERTWNGDV